MNLFFFHYYFNLNIMYSYVKKISNKIFRRLTIHNRLFIDKLSNTDIVLFIKNYENNKTIKNHSNRKCEYIFTLIIIFYTVFFVLRGLSIIFTNIYHQYSGFLFVYKNRNDWFFKFNVKLFHSRLTFIWIWYLFEFDIYSNLIMKFKSLWNLRRTNRKIVMWNFNSLMKHKLRLIVWFIEIMRFDRIIFFTIKLST